MSRRTTVLLLPLLSLLTPFLLHAQPHLERERSLEEGTRRAVELIAAGENLRAVELLDGLIDSAAPAADLSTPLFLLAEANAAVDRNYPALDATRRFLLLFPSDPRAGEVRYRRGVVAWRENNRAEARAAFEEIVRNKDDREGEAYYWLARMASEEDSLELAEALADKSLEQRDNEFTDDALYLSAWIKEGNGDYAGAATLYRRLVEDFPESDLTLDAQLRLGVNQAREGYHESAMTLFTSLSPRSDRQKEELLFYSAESNAALGRHDRAIPIYTDMLRLFPDSRRNRQVRYGLGWSQLMEERYDQSIASFSALTAGTDSLAAAALYQIGAIHTVRGDTVQSLAALHELVNRLPYESFSDNAYYLIGRMHYRRGVYDSARRYLQIAARQFPEGDVRVGAFHLLGESYAVLREYDNAQFAFSRARKLGDSLDPLAARSLFREGVMLYRVGRFTSTIDRLRQYVAAYPKGTDIAEATFWLGEALYQDREYGEAAQFYNTVVTSYPNSRYHLQAMYGLGWAHFRQRQFNQAITAYTAFIDKYPESPEAIEATIRLADSYRFIRQYDKAIAAYESIGGRAGAGAAAEEARVRMAEAFVEIGEYERAAEAYRDLVRKYPKSERIDGYDFAVGGTYSRAGEDSLAIGELTRFLGKYERSEYRPSAHNLIGDAWYNLGEYDTAIAWYVSVLDTYPNSPVIPESIEGLRFALEAMGRGPEAVAIIDDFVAKNPNRLAADSITFQKGMIYFDNMEYASADTVFRQLIADFPESGLQANAWYYIGKGKEYTGDVVGAIGVYRQVVDQFPTSNAALEGLISMAELRLQSTREYAAARNDFLLFAERFAESDRLNQARFGAGLASLNLGDTVAAVEQFRMLIDSAPVPGVGEEDRENDFYIDRSKVALADVLRAQDSASAALDLLAEVSARRRDYLAADALLMRGEISMELNDLSGALADLQRLTTEFVDYPESREPGLLRLGELYEKLTDTEKAIEAYQMLVDTGTDETLKKQAADRITALNRR